MILFIKALYLCLKYHWRQKDKGGKPYFLHPIRVMLRVKGYNNKIIALLHDTLEDTTMNWLRLYNKGFSKDIIQTIIVLTRSPSETYNQYIDRISKNHIATNIKIADIKDNLNLRRLKNISESDLNRNIKYLKAYKKLLKED